MEYKVQFRLETRTDFLIEARGRYALLGFGRFADMCTINFREVEIHGT